MGMTAFGFTALQSLRSVMKKHGWLSDEKLDEGIALVQLYPGPINFDYSAYLGYQLRGVPGAIITTFCFVLPSFVLMLVLSSAYFSSGNPDWIQRVFLGLEAIVVGILVNFILDLGKTALRNFKAVIIAIAALAGYVLKIDALWIVLAAICLGMICFHKDYSSKQNVMVQDAESPKKQAEWILIGIVVAVILGFVIFCTTLPQPINRMCLSLFKVGSIAFGNGLMILPVLRAEVVDTLKLLTAKEFTDGIVLGQITPGPFLITSAFIGYKVNGIIGAALAVFSIFSPTFAMTLVFTNIYNRIRNSIWIQAALAGIMAAFIGMLCLTTFQIAQVSITNFYAGFLAAAAFVATRYLRLNIFWVFFGGLSLWLIILAFNLV